MDKPIITEEELKAALPDTTSPIRVSGLDGSVEIYRDNFGIPHIKAESAHDALFGQGFATAQDRLWHMEYDRRRGYGRWAEVAGAEAVDGDKLMRRFRLQASAEADFRVLSDDAKAMLQAYAAGVNAWIKSANQLPIEFKILNLEPEPWKPMDCLLVYKVRHTLMGTFEEKMWRGLLLAHLGPEITAELHPGYPAGDLMIMPPGAEFIGPAVTALEELKRGAEAVNYLGEFEAGSNSWALNGDRTATGKPLVCGDSHRALDTPSVYYQNHIACPEFDTIGFSFPGIPGFPHFGHNAHVAWCVTHACADYQDLFIERFDPDDPARYEFKGEWEKAEVSSETISVRDADPVEIEVTVTRHGSIIAGDPSDGYALAFRYTATAEPNDWANALYSQLSVDSADELEEAMRVWVDPCNNYVFADVHGDACYLTRGKVPVRSKTNRWIPVPGWTGEHEWEGFVPFEAFPRARNPETGYIVTANNRIVEKDEPYFIGMDYVPEFRARSLQKRLRDIKGASAEEMPTLHAERTSIPAQGYTRLLAAVEPTDDLSAKAKELLVKWDGSMDRGLVEPTIYSAFRDRLARLVFGPFLGPLAAMAFDGTDRGAPRHLMRLKSALPRMIEEDDRTFLPEGVEWKMLMAKALAEGVASLSNHIGDDSFGERWRWGALHVTRPQHTLSVSFPHLGELLDPPSFEMHGDSDTPLQGGYGTERYVVAALSVNRYIFDLGDLNNSRWSVPLGASGHPGSPHYADQAPIWAEIELTPMLYDWSAIRDGAESHQTVSPEE